MEHDNRSSTTTSTNNQPQPKRRKRDSKSITVPKFRNLQHNLYTCMETFNCAIHSQCISCAYKIGCFDIAQDVHFTKIVPNVRPELCPRSYSTPKTKCGRANRTELQPSTTITDTNNIKEKENGLYGTTIMSGMKILTIGDGDFSFSLALARRMSSTTTLIATSYESRTTVESVYPNVGTTLQELQQLGAKVYFTVNATQLISSLDKSIKFHRIVWNFPCTAIPNGQDGQNNVMEDNKELLVKFLNSAKPFLSVENGEIHMMHKTKPPYHQWNLHDISTPHQDIQYKGRIVLDKCLVPPYTPRKALDKKSFPCHDACIYIYGWSDYEQGRFVPTIPLVQHKDSKIVPVTKEMIQEIRNKHLEYSIIRKQQKQQQAPTPKKKNKKRRCY